MIALSIIGCTGKTGQFLKELIDKKASWSEKYKIVDLINSKNNPSSISQDSELVIDFSSRQVSLEWAEKLKSSSVPCLIASTGFTDSDLELLNKLHSQKAWTLAPNCSLGVYHLKKALEEIIFHSPLNWKAKISESHHTHKLDAPSGTAKFLAESFESDSNQSAQLGDIESIREGDVVGKHQIHLSTEYEEISLSHNALDRRLFADGALSLGIELHKKASLAQFYPLSSLIDSP